MDICSKIKIQPFGPKQNNYPKISSSDLSNLLVINKIE